MSFGDGSRNPSPAHLRRTPAPRAPRPRSPSPVASSYPPIVLVDGEDRASDLIPLNALGQSVGDISTARTKLGRAIARLSELGRIDVGEPDDGFADPESVAVGHRRVARASIAATSG
jgi:hypothetical protein